MSTDRPSVAHGTEPRIPLNPFEGVQILDTLFGEGLDMFAWQRIVFVPVGRCELRDPDGFVRS